MEQLNTFTNAMQDFLNEIGAFKNTDAIKSVWFRGQGVDFPLHSGLFRSEKLRKDIHDLRKREETAYRTFISQGHTYLKGERDWELLFIMQHHGLRTRLLDWTPSLMTALYFATINPITPVLWMLRPSKLNYMNLALDSIFSLPLLSKYEDIMFKPEKFITAAIQPIRNSARQIIQQGMFTIQGDTNVPLEMEWGGQIVEDGYLKKIPIPKDLVEEIHFLLELNNISHSTIYPDLDGLSVDINRRYLSVEE
ncbi:FRG domain-containing protein [Paenibacillus barcinonensis]|uniref:FRG domain-containing protein n=1 Tax=Paenibacillus barcinonensis TaxID=198119 RepID=A0A2V4WEA6_PAEBA|nr:FRG domain-containing protein [Paenibacillus barcinonensis]PYE49833.1 FRG domain-containing protein [Paenibacillus barcinonensis]QKS56492.1 FRG domain-containing protein [Paenibacillus barcinonensis]